MLRGVNKRVVEVVEMDHEYFERAILIVREGKEDGEERQLKTEAGRYLSQLQYRRPPAVKRLWSRCALGALKLGGAAALGATVMSLIKF